MHLRQKFDVGIDPSAQQVAAVVDSQLYPHHFVYPFFPSLDITWKKFCLLAYLLHTSGERSMWKAVDADLGFVANVNSAYFRLRNIDHHVKLVSFEYFGQGCIRRQQVAGSDVHGFDHDGGRDPDLAFRISCLSFVELALGQSHLSACRSNIFVAETAFSASLNGGGFAQAARGRSDCMLQALDLCLGHSEPG